MFSSATDWLPDTGLILPTGFEKLDHDDWLGEAPSGRTSGLLLWGEVRGQACAVVERVRGKLTVIFVIKLLALILSTPEHCRQCDLRYPRGVPWGAVFAHASAWQVGHPSPLG